MHLISDELLAAYANGLLCEPLSLLVATHLSLCPDARLRCREFEALAGVMLDAIEPVEVSADCRRSMLRRLDNLDLPSGTRKPAPSMRPAGPVPSPLAAYVGPDYDALPWRTFGAVSEIKLLPNAEGYVTRLLKIRPGATIPDHTHEGLEATLVLRGSFSDHTGTYGPGDVALHEGDVDHSPVAGGGEPCICLAVTDAPLRLTGTIGRFLNPFVRM
ncbi:MAG: ChrR family anti-sigma-E factor [Pseudomonadota bacterium]